MTPPAQTHAAATGLRAWVMRFNWKLALEGVGYAILLTALLALALRLLARGAALLHRKVTSWHGKRIRSLRIQRLELVPAARITATLHTFAGIVRLAATLVLLYAYVTALTAFFPGTHRIAAALVGWLVTPLRLIGQQFAAYVPNLFYLAVILAASYYLTRFVRLIFRELGKGTIALRGFYAEWAEPTYKIARALIVVFTLVAAFPYLPGSKSPAFQGISLFFGLLLSLGSSSAIANMVAGTVLTYTRAFQLGDRVTIGETTGDIVEKTLLVTRVRTIKNVEVAIPNSMVMGGHIHNFTKAAAKSALILHTGVTIGYDTPWRTVHALLLDAARRTEGLRADPKPFVLQTALNDFYVAYEINAYTADAQRMAQTYSDLRQNIQDAFFEAGVEIMSPHVYGVRDSNRAAIPAERLPPDYTAPGFRITPAAQQPHPGAKAAPGGE